MLPQAWNLTDLFCKVFGPFGLQWPSDFRFKISVAFRFVSQSFWTPWPSVALPCHLGLLIFQPDAKCKQLFMKVVETYVARISCSALQLFWAYKIYEQIFWILWSSILSFSSRLHMTHHSVHCASAGRHPICVWSDRAALLLPFLAFPLKSLNTDVISFHIFGRILGILEARAFFFVCILYLKTVSWYW